MEWLTNQKSDLVETPPSDIKVQVIGDMIGYAKVRSDAPTRAKAVTVLQVDEDIGAQINAYVEGEIYIHNDVL